VFLEVQSNYVAKSATPCLQGCRYAVVATGSRDLRLPSFIDLCLSELGGAFSFSLCLASGANSSGHKQSSYVAKSATPCLQGCRYAVVATGSRDLRLPSFIDLCLSELGGAFSFSS